MSTKTMQSMDLIKNKLSEADAIVIGAGAGLTASAGIDYMDVAFFSDKYPMFLKKGYKTIWDGITNNWQISAENASIYWGFWCHHINNVYYEPGQLASYKKLYDVISGKKHFIITTNADGQFFKGNFKKENIFAMQGSYGYFQCRKGCHNKLYDNQEMVAQMIEGFDNETLEIRASDIPYCPKCGELLIPNLRIDQFFVEGMHMEHHDSYIDFINKHSNGRLVFLELGVGFNTPSIIRYPFEEMTRLINHATLIRVNKESEQVKSSIADKIIIAQINIDELIQQLAH